MIENQESWQMLMDWGYLAIMLAVALEGELVLIIAGVAVAAGLFSYPLAILAALVAAIIHDNTIFSISRYAGIRIINKKTSWRTKIDILLQRLEKYDIWAILSIRFLYGIKRPSIFVVGISKVNRLKFFILDAISCVAWTTLYISLGYFFGHIILDFIYNSDIMHKVSENALMYIFIFIMTIIIIYSALRLLSAILRGYKR
jgi:membrane protein DedA with SNARE-associated domain